MKKKYKILVTSMLVALITASAFAFTDISIKNVLKTSGIDIKLTSTTDESLYSAGKCIKHEPAIYNNGMDCYVRFKTDLLGGVINKDDVFGVKESSIKKGDYYYYKYPIRKGEKIILYKGFNIPMDIDNADKSEIKIIDTVDAIQSKNFKPNFNSLNPWGDVTIKESSFNGNSYVNEVTKIKPINIEIRKESIYLLENQKILNNMLSPKDTYKNKIKITNYYSQKMDINFKTSAKESKLLKALDVKIFADDKLIYDGDLQAYKLRKEQKMAALKPGESINIDYLITADEKLDNKYQDLEGEFEWIFNAKPSNVTRVKTGDDSNLIAGIIAMISAIVIAIFTIKKEDEE